MPPDDQPASNPQPSMEPQVFSPTTPSASDNPSTPQEPTTGPVTWPNPAPTSPTTPPAAEPTPSPSPEPALSMPEPVSAPPNMPTPEAVDVSPAPDTTSSPPPPPNPAPEPPSPNQNFTPMPPPPAGDVPPPPNNGGPFTNPFAGEQTPPPPPAKSGGKAKKLAVVIGIVAALVVLGLGGWYFMHKKSSTTSSSTSSSSSSTSNSALNEFSVQDVSDYSKVCQGAHAVNATDYSTGANPHPIVLFQPSVASSDSYVETTVTFKNTAWESDSKDATTTQLVGCFKIKSQGTSTKKCDFTSDGKQVTLDYIPVVYELTIYEAKTGNKLATKDVSGPATTCPLLATFDKNDPKLYGDPDNGLTEAAVTEFVSK